MDNNAGTEQLCHIPTESSFGGGAKDTSQKSNIVKKADLTAKIGLKLVKIQHSWDLTCW